MSKSQAMISGSSSTGSSSFVSFAG